MKADVGAAGGPGQSMKGEAGAVGGPGQSMKEDAGASGGPGQSMKEDAGASSGPGQSMKGEAGGPGQPGASMGDGGASGGPGQPAAEKGADVGASGGPDSAKGKKAEAELKAGAPGKGKTEDGASGGSGAAADEDDLVDPDADRPNFGTVAPDDEDADEEEDEAAASGSARAGAKGGKAAKKKAERKPVDPAYVTVGIMGLAVLSLAAMIWLGRGILMEMWPGISGFYKSVGVEAAKPGDGLKIAESSKRLQRIGGVETLVVRGFISNISDLPTAVPKLRLELYNEKREVIQDSGANAPVGLLDPNGSVEFEIRMELPQLNLAKGGYGVVWAH